MEHGRHAHASPRPQLAGHPVYSRDLTLQAHFTFGTPSMAPVQYAHVTPTSTSAHSGRPLMASGASREHWQWSGGGGAHCSITCGREGLTMTYNAHPAAHDAHPTAHDAHPDADDAHPAAPCPICAAPAAAATPGHDAGVMGGPALTRSLVDLSRPQEQVAARSLTFSGSLDRATQRPAHQRPYGRRCKSTAHIVLQNNEGLTAPRPHEFHATLREEGGAAHAHTGPEGRGRARVRAPPASVGGGWQRQEHPPGGQVLQGGGAVQPPTAPPIVPPCCTCHHCSALFSLVSSLAHPRPCYACAHCPPSPPTPRRHHQDPPPTDDGGARAHPPPRSPTVRTFNSHRCYEDEGVRRGQPPTCRRSRTPSPRMLDRGRSPSPPHASPHASHSPDRRGDGAEDRHPHATPQATPRRVPRMGAAAAAAAAASSRTAVQGEAVCGGQPSSRDWRPRVRHQKPRPRTIHIDVYCSSDDDLDDSSPSSPTSEDTLDSGSRRPHAVVALGSKQRKKTELNLGRHHYHPLEEKASSFVYSRGRTHEPHAGRRSTFITDDVLQLCSSPPRTTPDKEDVETPLLPDSSTIRPEAPDSCTATPTATRQSPIPMPAPPPPPRPTTLAMPISPLPQPSDSSGLRPHSRHSSLSYLSSPMDVDPWEGEPELPDSALSWRGSEFETSTPRFTSDLDLPSPRAASELSLSSLHEAFYEREGGEPVGGLDVQESPRMWRSPHLERQRYIQKGQEDRYREARKRRTHQEAQQSFTATPSSVVELAKLPAFKDFSKEDLKVISKSLEKRVSPQSSDKEPVVLPEPKESFRPTEKESNRLLEWMQQYKAQESQESTTSQELQDSESLGYAESGKSLEGTDSFRSMESKDSFGTVARRKSTAGISGSADPDSSIKIEKRDSLKTLEMKDVLGFLERKESTKSMERRETGRSLERREPGRPLEKRDSFKFQDKREYYRALEKRDSGRASERKEYIRSLHRGESGRSLERKESLSSLEGQESGWPIERRDSGRLERKDSGRLLRSDSGGYSETKCTYQTQGGRGRTESLDSGDRTQKRVAREESVKTHETSEPGLERKDVDRPVDVKRSASFLEQFLEREESSRSGSVEWQDVVSTVRRRLSACAQQTATEAARSPVGEAPAAPAIEAPTSSQAPHHENLTSPLPQRRLGRFGRRRDVFHGDDERDTTTVVGGRIINVGLFRHLSRFPFSQTVPVPASRLMEARTTCVPEQRKFVRPQLFGEMTLSYPKRRGIHFGPPRNPQCSCENCRSWAEVSSGGQIQGSRLRAWSLTDLESETGESSSMVLPLHPSSFPGTSLSRANSSVSDSSTLSHVGAAAVGGKQS